MSVKAKFKCTQVAENEYNKTAQLSAVYSHGSDENADFTKLTPAGKIEITIDKDAPASEYFKPGKEYYLVFDEAEKA
ncbi:hypothetical protein ACLI1A_10350 [Flavobacterium sp. RHBU_3]|uniref:hypothetical protein n=1 Tax=Flavobacterium sp. RHBU_3 TaxID=3391184 RepID=UPI003984DEA9